MRFRRLFFFMVFLVAAQVATAQISVDFIPAISGTTLDGLMNVRINNFGQKRTVKLQVTVSFEDEVSSVQMVEIRTSAFDVYPGTNIVPPSILKTSQVKIGTSEPARFLQQNGYFPSGQYSYDYKVFSATTQEVLVDQNFVHELQPPAPLNLIEPFDKDEVCEHRPLLSWQPHIPMTAGTMYQVVLVEVKNKQNGIEALQYNLPIVNQRNISANLLMYPAVARELEKDKKYAWQVTAYQGNTVLNRSEVWTFNMKCADSIVESKPELSYRDIEDLAKGNFYLAEGRLNFVLVNSYAEQPLQYSISCLTDPKIKVKNLPQRKLSRGKNKIDIELSENRAFRNDYSYMLTVVMPNGQIKNLRFVYKEKR
jgi:hypothetical protein